MVDEVTDRAGRRIKLRRVGVLETLRLIKAVGGELAANQAYMNAAAVAASAAMIDDVPLPFPASEASLEALMERLGDDGVLAILDMVKPPPPKMVVADAGN